MGDTRKFLNDQMTKMLDHARPADRMTMPPEHDLNRSIPRGVTPNRSAPNVILDNSLGRRRQLSPTRFVIPQVLSSASKPKDDQIAKNKLIQMQSALKDTDGLRKTDTGTPIV